jgi:hypothetical protein
LTLFALCVKIILNEVGCPYQNIYKKYCFLASGGKFMTFLDVFLKILAILGIIAVGTFIIVFLSDLLISIIDNSNGIFFRRNKGGSSRGGSYARPKMITQQREEYEKLEQRWRG